MFSIACTSSDVLAVHFFDGRIAFLWVQSTRPVVGVRIAESNASFIETVPDPYVSSASLPGCMHIPSRTDLARFAEPWCGTRPLLGVAPGPTDQARFVRVPYWVLAGLFAIPLVPSIIQRLQRRRLVRRGLCQKCRYELTGHLSGVCPECGTAVPSDAKSMAPVDRAQLRRGERE
jgi:hypothetical protein